MKWSHAVPLLAATMIALAAAEQATPDPAATQPTPLPDIQQAIPAAVSRLAAPTTVEFPGGIVMAVTTGSGKAQEHVLQGLNHLHGGWEFEASRHFAAAMREDPDCLLAHWGMLMSMLESSPETLDARRAVVVRMIHLMNAGVGTKLERGYVEGILHYLKDGPGAAASAFATVSERFPNEMQAAIFAALFKRGGYDTTGAATPDQIESEKQLRALIERHPDSPVPANALLVIHAEAPHVEESLALARKVCQAQPGYPPAFHTLGHYEWRNGNHKLAAAAFGRASMLYQNWMRQNQVGVADCPEWIKAECYRVVALLSMGDDETAFAAARQIAATPLPDDRKASAGTRALLWDAVTLPARILIHRGRPTSTEEAAMQLPDPAHITPYHQDSFAFLWIDGLRLGLEVQRLIDGGELEKARDTATVLENHIAMIAGVRQQAWAAGEGSQWIRSQRALKVLLGDLRGRTALAGPMDMRGSAFNWFTSSVDHQRFESMLNPPLILTPMATRLGEYFMRLEQPTKAIAAYQQALASFPGDKQSLTGLRAAYIAANEPDKAAETAVKILELQQD